MVVVVNDGLLQIQMSAFTMSAIQFIKFSIIGVVFEINQRLSFITTAIEPYNS